MSDSPPSLDPIYPWLDARWPPSERQSRRLFHGRGQCFPGLEHLTVDWHPPLLLLTAYRPLANDQALKLLAHLDRRAPDVISCAAIQERGSLQPELRLLRGELPDRPLAREGGLVYPLLLGQGVNHGFFLDMARGRRWLQEQGTGKTVLNLFAYTCTVSVAALSGGAERVINLDMSRASLAVGKEAHRLNRIDPRRAGFLAHDLFKSFGRLRRLGPFDLVVIDPPAAQGKSFSARRDWGRILRRLPDLLKPGGDICACVSAPELGRRFLEQQFEEHLPAAVQAGHLAAGEDFPERDPDKGWHLLHYRLT